MSRWKNTVVDLAGRETIADPLTEMLRTNRESGGGLQELLEQHGERYRGWQGRRCA